MLQMEIQGYGVVPGSGTVRQTGDHGVAGGAVGLKGRTFHNSHHRIGTGLCTVQLFQCVGIIGGILPEGVAVLGQAASHLQGQGIAHMKIDSTVFGDVLGNDDFVLRFRKPPFGQVDGK